MDRFATRVWDKHKNEYIPKDDYYLNARGQLRFYEGKHRGEWSKERYVKEQCLGIKDKDDNFFYEGDIYKNRFRPLGADKDEYYSIRIIKFLDGCFKAKWVLTKSKRRINDYKLEIKKGNRPYIQMQISIIQQFKPNYEIIGNIHENPELLTTKTKE